MSFLMQVSWPRLPKTGPDSGNPADGKLGQSPECSRDCRELLETQEVCGSLISIAEKKSSGATAFKVAPWAESTKAQMF